MKLTNHTPHLIQIIFADGTAHSLPPAAPTIRLESSNGNQLERGVRFDEFGLVPIVLPVQYDGINYIPDPDHSYVLVSSMVAEFIMARPDLAAQFKGIYAPDTSPQGVVRDDKGFIVGTRRLVKYK